MQPEVLACISDANMLKITCNINIIENILIIL